MKKLLIIAAILGMASIAQAGDFFGSAQFGYDINNMYYRTQVELGYALPVGPIDVVGWTGILSDENFYNDNGFSFAPYRVTFNVGVEIEYENMFLKIEHFCDHPVAYYWDGEQNIYYSEKYYPGIGFTGTFITLGVRWGEHRR